MRRVRCWTIVRALSVLSLALDPAGCYMAHMVQPPGERPSQYAPTNARDRTGIIMYSMDATPNMVQRRREAAFKKMHDACHGPYRIVAEGVHVVGGDVTPAGTSSIEWHDW